LKQREAGCDGALEAEELTRDHKPNLPAERARIEKLGGRVVFDGCCHRVARRNCRPGLNMSRSLGDAIAHSSCGVSAHPDVLVRPLTSDDRALLVASDGIWEVISPDEAAEIVASFGPERAMEAARCLADKAVSRWLRVTGGRMTDDITAVLAWLPSNRPALDRMDTRSTVGPSTESPSASASVGAASWSDASWEAGEAS